MLTIVIQAGGQSNRMGQDKALLSFLGRPLIERVLERVSPLADETLITTNTPAGFRYLEIPLIPDIIPKRGALGGLYTALCAARGDLVAVIACDMPFVNADILAACRNILLNTPVDAAIPRAEHGLEPLHAIYRRATCLPAVKAAIDADQWRMIAWHKNAQIHEVPEDILYPLDPRGLAFMNVNTPEEFRRAETLSDSAN
ncbi:MAG: molybdenum cofactor guanylyltransferase [Anaerolineae bacterium]|nr:molybdenum cofactor guanylyltransferase [Anaerolineae bacterium]